MLPCCCCCCCLCCYADVTDASCIVSTLLAAYLPIGFISRKPCAAHSSLLTIHTAQLSTRRQSILCYVWFTFGCFAGLSVCPDYDHVLRSCRLVTNRFKLMYTIPPGRVPVLCQALRIFGYYKYALLFVLCVCLSAWYLSVTPLLQKGVVRFLCNLGCLLILWSSCAECNFSPSSSRSYKIYQNWHIGPIRSPPYCPSHLQMTAYVENPWRSFVHPSMTNILARHEGGDRPRLAQGHYTKHAIRMFLL